MSVLVVPELDKKPWPTLGPQVCRFIETNLVHGPGDLRGQPVRLDPEKRALIYRTYEVYPQKHPMAGRRRFKRVAWSLRKGSAKTELAALVAACELHPEAPVRCVGWDKRGEPIGAGVTDPYIPMVAYTEEQSEDLAYGALRAILEHSKVARDFDLGLKRIMRIAGDGKAEALASAPDARDGARTTFQHFDETHRLTLPRLKQAHRTMLANVPKRKLADAWSLETTTAPAPGEGSVAEDTMEYAKAVVDGRVKDEKASRLFFFHRQADDGHDLTTPKGIRAAVLEASGPVASWSDIDGIVEQWSDPTADRAYLERVWLNRLVRASDRAFDFTAFKELVRPDYLPPDGAHITLGFDGARYEDAAALVGTEVPTGYQFTLGVWEKPYLAHPDPAATPWEVPEDEVNAAVDEAFRRWKVWKLYADPPYWESTVAAWAGKYGGDGEKARVVRWPTNRWPKIAGAVLAYANAIIDGHLSHDGHAALLRHVGNAYRRVLTQRDDKGVPLWVIQKERPDSPSKIDAAMGAVLSWEARRDALAAGVGLKKRSKYETQVPFVLGGEPPPAPPQDEARP